MATLPSLGREWFNPPDFTIPPPPDGPVRLGVLLADSQELNSIICDARSNAVDSTIFHGVQNQYKFSSFRKNGKNWGVWASFLNVGLDATNRGNFITMECERLETHSFSPTTEFIGKCVEQKEVKTWIKARRKKPLYMITGIKVAQNAQLQMEGKSSTTFEAGIGVGSIVTPGVPISVGSSVSISRTVISGFESASYNTNFVFAYKLQKLKFSEIKPYFQTHNKDARKTSRDSAAVPSSPTKVAPDQPPIRKPLQTHAFQQDDIEDTVKVETEEVNASDTDEPLRILSLDGGGVRGISSLLLLKKIMDRVREERDLQGHVEVEPSSKNPGNNKQLRSIRPCEYFDLICGTSTGGLIAILLGRLQCVSATPGSHSD